MYTASWPVRHLSPHKHVLLIFQFAILSIPALSSLYRSEAAALNEAERTTFANFCEVLGRQLVPYMNRCLEAIFPSSALTIMQGISSSAAGSSLRLDVKSLQLLLEPVMPQETTQEEKPPREKEAQSRLSVSQDIAQNNEEPLHENEVTDNHVELENTVLTEESPTGQELRQETTIEILKTERQEPDLT